MQNFAPAAMVEEGGAALRVEHLRSLLQSTDLFVWKNAANVGAGVGDVDCFGTYASFEKLWRNVAAMLDAAGPYVLAARCHHVPGLSRVLLFPSECVDVFHIDVYHDALRWGLRFTNLPRLRTRIVSGGALPVDHLDPAADGIVRVFYGPWFKLVPPSMSRRAELGEGVSRVWKEHGSDLKAASRAIFGAQIGGMIVGHLQQALHPANSSWSGPTRILSWLVVEHGADPKLIAKRLRFRLALQRPADICSVATLVRERRRLPTNARERANAISVIARDHELYIRGGFIPFSGESWI